MTEQQISIVKKSWKIFRQIDSSLIGDAFYGKLFVELPEVKPLFRIPRSEQSKKLVEMLSAVVGGLDRISELNDKIRHLAIRHAGYGVKVSHYKAVGDALIWTLRQGMGDDWNKDVESAWKACYKTLSDTMIASANNVQETY